MSPAQSSFHPGKTIGTVAQEMADHLVAAAHQGTLREGLPYATRRYQLVQFVVAFGGPNADVEFVIDPEDNEVLSGTYTYAEMAGKAKVELPLPDAMRLFEVLNEAADQ